MTGFVLLHRERPICTVAAYEIAGAGVHVSFNSQLAEDAGAVRRLTRRSPERKPLAEQPLAWRQVDEILAARRALRS
jgi:hypothetical protein